MTFEVTGFKVNTVAATVAAGGATATVTLPHTAAGADVVITDVTASDSVGTCTATVPASTKVASGNVTVTVTDGTNTATTTLTITVAPSNECNITSFTISGIQTSISGTTITLLVPADADLTELTPTIAVSTGASISPASGVAQNFSSTVTYTVTAEDTTTTKTYTTAIDKIDSVVVKNINMAGWYKVKVVELKDFNYASGGFVPPYKAKAVLAVNGAGGLTGYVYMDTSGSAPVQKVKIFAGTSEFTGELTADVYLLLE